MAIYSGESYPEQEHLDVPTTAAERLREELRTSGAGRELRDRVLLGLGGIYSHTTLGRSFYVYSDIAARQALGVAKEDMDQDNQEVVRLAHMQLVYSGSLMAMHVGLSSPYCTARREVLQSSLAGVPEMVAGNSLMRVLVAEHLQAVRDEMPFMLLREYTAEDKEALGAFVQTALTDIDDENAHTFGEDVRLGYVYGTHAINRMKQRLGGASIGALGVQ